MKHVSLDIRSCLECPHCKYSATFRFHYCTLAKGHYKERRTHVDGAFREDCPLKESKS